MLITDKGSLVTTEWLADELATAYETPKYHANQRLEPVSTIELQNNVAWFGGLTSIAQAKDLLIEGWRAGAERLQSVASAVTHPNAKSRVRRQRNVEDGDELILHKALAGDADCWRSARATWSNTPRHVDLAAMFGGACTLTAEQMFWVGAVGVVLTDALESAGYAVRFTASAFAHPTMYAMSTLIRTHVILKDYQEPLRMDSVASVLCHAGVFRTFGFRALITAPRQCDEGMGYYPHNTRTWEGVRSFLEPVGEWDSTTIRLNAVKSKLECEAEIERVLKLFA